MNKTSVATRIIVGICLAICLGTIANAQKKSSKQTLNQKEKIVTKHAKGTGKHFYEFVYSLPGIK